MLPLEVEPATLCKEGHDDHVSELDALTTRESVYSIASQFVGVGVLSVPYAFRLSGFFPTAVIIILIAALTSHTAKQLGASLVLASRTSCVRPRPPPKCRDYGYLSTVAFGKWGCYFMTFVLSVECWLGIITFSIMAGINTSLIIPNLSRRSEVFFSTCLAASLSAVPMRMLSYVSLVGFFAVCLTTFSFFVAAFKLDAWALFPRQDRSHWNITQTAGIILFFFEGHHCLPAVHQCMRQPSHWGRSVNMTFVISLCFCFSVGICGYLAFGDGTEESFVENIAHVEGAGFWRDVALAASTVKILLTTPWDFVVLMGLLWPPASDERSWTPFRMAFFILLTMGTAAIACTLDDDVIAVSALAGNVTGVVTCVLFPLLVRLQLGRHNGHRDRSGTRRIDVTLLLVGMSWAIVTAVDSAKGLIGHMSR